MRLKRSLYFGAAYGAVAWSAYAVGEFVCSVALGMVRPYSIFTNWHWQLTAMLMAAYLAAGLAAGALAGLALSLLSRVVHFPDRADAERVLELGATVTLVLAFAANTIFTPVQALGKPPLFVTTIVMGVLLTLAAASRRWSERLGFLTNPWVVSASLLGVGLDLGLLQTMGDSEQLDRRLRWFAVLLTVALVALVIGAIVLERRLRPLLLRHPAALSAHGWLAVGSALILVAASTWLSRGGPAPVREAHAAAAPNFGRPNVVLIVLDTVRADHMSLYGYGRDTTPNLRALARDSMVFTNAIAPSDMTLSSHASMFTGLYPSWHGAHCDPPGSAYGRELSHGLPTIAGILSASRYSTVGVSANLYLRSQFGLQKGFETFRIPRPVPVLDAEAWYQLRRGMRRGLSYLTDTAQFDRLYARSEDINQIAFTELDSRLDKGPFFLFVNYMDAHFPYVPPAPWSGLFPGRGRRVTQDDLEAIQHDIIEGRPVPASYQAHCASQYDGGIAYDDAQVGRLVSWLKQSGVYENTLIVVASDHGEAFGEKSLVMHANSVYQNLLHVALLMKFPKRAHTGIVKDPVSLVDIAPTVLTALGQPVPAGMQGQNLLAPTAGPRQLFSESFPCPALHTMACPRGCLERAAFSWPNKFIISSSGNRELYDLSADPNETSNLVRSHSPEARQLSLELGRWIKTMPAKSSDQAPMDRESLQRLKSLGYVQ